MTRTSTAAGRTLFLDPWTGVSGDMLLGALLAVGEGDPRLMDVLRETVGSLGLPADLVTVDRVTERGVGAIRVTVASEKCPPMRHLADMVRMVEGAGLSGWVAERSLAALKRLAQVEADVHGCTPEEIHFHEVGAADTLVDVVGTFALLAALGIDEVVVGPIQVGGGTVEIAHGRMGVPAPATARLLQGYPVLAGPEMRELTTPTGALLVSQMSARPEAMPSMTLEAVGYGAGSMALDCGPNVLRAFLGRQESRRPGGDVGGFAEPIVTLETNLDDVSGEVVGHACAALRAAGALDVWTSPVFGKKDRPAVVLHVLAAPGDEVALAELVFRETGTLGVRRSDGSRWVVERGWVEVEVAGHVVAVKWGRRDGDLTSLAAEYDDAAAVAAASGLALPEVMRRATAAAAALLQARTRAGGRSVQAGTTMEVGS